VRVVLEETEACVGDFLDVRRTQGSVSQHLNFEERRQNQINLDKRVHKKSRAVAVVDLSRPLFRQVLSHTPWMLRFSPSVIVMCNLKYFILRNIAFLSGAERMAQNTVYATVIVEVQGRA